MSEKIDTTPCLVNSVEKRSISCPSPLTPRAVFYKLKTMPLHNIREIYLDHAATTYLDPRVRESMEPYWELEYGNPSSLSRPGRRAKEALDKARETIAQLLNCRSDELTFTGGGTEAINLAIFGAVKQYGVPFQTKFCTGG